MAKDQQRPLFPVADQQQMPAINVTPEQHEELRAYMLPMAQEVIREGPTWGRSNVGSAQERGWKLVNSTLESCFLTKNSGKNYQSLNKARDKVQQQQQPCVPAMQTPPTAAQCFMGFSTAPSSLEAIMSSVYCETTEELRVHSRDTYGSVCLDSCVLATLEGATLEDPFWYLGIKWIALKSPVKKLLSSREFAFLELSGTHVTSDGQRMLYRILQSVNLRGYGGKDAYFGLTRAHIEVAYVYWVDEAASTPERPVLNVCTKGRAHLKGNLPLWLVQLYLKKLWTLRRSRQSDEVLQSALGSIEFQARMRSIESERESPRSSAGGGGGSSGRGISGRIGRIGESGGGDSAPFDMATTWVPNEDRSACSVCRKRFQLVRRPKHHCRACGEIICSDCTSYAKLNVPTPIARKRSSRALLMTIESTTHAIIRSSLAPTPASEPFSMATSSQKARARTPRNVVPGEALGTYVTVGKVCHQCMDLKAIMHNNSVAYRHRPSSPPGAPRMIVWKHGAEKLLTLHSERDDSDEAIAPSSSANFNHSFTSTTNHNVAHGLSSSSDDEEKYGAMEPGSWRAAGLVVDAAKYRKGSISSLTSSDVRAIIEENGSAADHTTEGGRSSVATVEERYDDAEDEDEDEGHEDLEFKPAEAVSAHELLASSEANANANANANADYDSSCSGSLSNFNPDALFDLHGELSDDAEGGSDADLEDSSKEDGSKDAVGSLESYEPLAMALLSPTASTPPSTPSWSRSRTHTSSVSIFDVKLAIDGHAELLDAVVRHED